MSDERDGTFRSVINETKDQTADIADQVKSAAEDFYGQARDSASQIADAARRSMTIPRNTASSLQDASPDPLRTLEPQVLPRAVRFAPFG
jgi:hypothetical protein